MSFEHLRVPDLPHQQTEPCQQFGFRVVLVQVVCVELGGVEDEVVSERDDLREGVDDDVHEVVGFDVVQTDEAG